jgi:hypothetical protein
MEIDYDVTKLNVIAGYGSVQILKDPDLSDPKAYGSCGS